MDMLGFQEVPYRPRYHFDKVRDNGEPPRFCLQGSSTGCCINQKYSNTNYFSHIAASGEVRVEKCSKTHHHRGAEGPPRVFRYIFDLFAYTLGNHIHQEFSYVSRPKPGGGVYIYIYIFGALDMWEVCGSV